MGWALELFLGTSQLHGNQLPTEVGVEQGAPNWVDQLTATSKERPTSSFFELMLANISSKLLTVPGSGLALYAVGCRGERGPNARMGHTVSPGLPGPYKTVNYSQCLHTTCKHSRGGCVYLLTVGSLKGPSSVTPPASFHFGRPPSRMESIWCPIVWNTHHTRAAENMPNCSLLS